MSLSLSIYIYVYIILYKYVYTYTYSYIHALRGSLAPQVPSLAPRAPATGRAMKILGVPDGGAGDRCCITIVLYTV